MILPYLSEINKNNIILASGSPRRQELLSGIGLKFSVITSNEDEDADRSEPTHYVEQNALKKGRSVARENPYDYVISADTVVVLDNEILEKPKSEQHAKELLLSISKRQHSVVTGVSILYKDSEIYFHEKTDVEIDLLTETFIDAYIATGDPMDKAGAYGIQGIGASFVKRVNGCYYNVMGFPVSKFINTFIKLAKIN